MSEFVLAHGAPELKLVHFETQANNLLGRFGQAANQALFAVQELEVKTELTIEQVAEHFGIHDFGLQTMAKTFSNCTIKLTPDGHLEIHREEQAHPTRFQVARKQLLAA